MKYYEIYPEVSGYISEDSILDASSRPIKISKMHYIFDGWLGDDIITEAGHFIVTENLGKMIAAHKLSGFHLEEATVSKSEQFMDIYPEKNLPLFKWLIIDGKEYKNDFGFLKEKMMLIISEDALSVLSSFKLNNCDVEEI